MLGTRISAIVFAGLSVAGCAKTAAQPEVKLNPSPRNWEITVIDVMSGEVKNYMALQSEFLFSPRDDHQCDLAPAETNYEPTGYTTQRKLVCFPKEHPSFLYGTAVVCTETSTGFSSFFILSRDFSKETRVIVTCK